MPIETPNIGAARVSPTKNFFVRMLTRDIELQDAILDLLDNCIDGILRSADFHISQGEPYKDYFAKITMEDSHFVIEDNCGGIPFDVAKKYAFAMGRPPEADQIDPTKPATIGMYGIGMKRAIFKLGTDALVESRNDTGFVVEFTPNWMANDEWDDLPMYELPDEKLTERGTRIEVYELNEEVKAAFSDRSWIDEFRKTVARHYAIIISKGFSVTVGSPKELQDGLLPIVAEPFKILNTNQNVPEGSRIAPYIYTGTMDGVKIEIFAGLYRELLSEEEAEAEEETRGTADDAGWTVACNDRIVIWKDKSRLTGWGEATVPNYHGQFIAITGLLLLQSDDLRKLPLTTTKRGIDASSNVYLEAKDLMRDATKSLTSFTNKWKKFPEQREAMYSSGEYVDLPRLRELATSVPMVTSRKHADIRKFEPKYPEPAREKTSARVSFVASKTDVQLLAKHYFENAQTKPGEVGEAAFNDALKRVMVSSK